MNAKRGLGVLAVVAGIVLLAVGGVSLRALLAAPLESQRASLPQVVFPLVVGAWLFVGGLYALRHP